MRKRRIANVSPDQPCTHVFLGILSGVDMMVVHILVPEHHGPRKEQLQLSEK